MQAVKLIILTVAAVLSILSAAAAYMLGDTQSTVIGIVIALVYYGILFSEL